MPGALIYGELYRAQHEILTSDPSAGVTARLIFNSTEHRHKFDNGSAYRAMLANDAYCVIGNHATAANNIRFNRAAAGVLQLVTADDSTAEGSLSTALAQLSFKMESAATGSLPAAAVAGRLLYDTTLGIPKFDTGAAIKTLASLDATQAFTNKSVDDQIDFKAISTPANPASGYLRLYVKSDNIVYTKTSGGTELALSTSNSSEPRANFLLNSQFSIWQSTGAASGTSASTTIANGVTSYTADQWFVKNGLGTNGVITVSRVAGSSDMAKYGLKVLISTAPTAAQANVCELYQTIGNLDSLQLYNQTASFAVKVKAFGNVNQVGIQFLYETTEIKCTRSNVIGSEQTVSVNTSTFTDCTIAGQAIGTSQTTSGVIGVVIRITGVSSGNLYALNNGFSIELPILSKSAVLVPYQPAYKTFAQELSACRYYYQKSYNLDVPPNSSTSTGRITSVRGNGAALASVKFSPSMRVAPTLVFYSQSPAANKVFNLNSSADNSVTSQNVSDSGGEGSVSTAITSDALGYHYEADARL